jgi:hypothetical protein
MREDKIKNTHYEIVCVTVWMLAYVIILLNSMSCYGLHFPVILFFFCVHMAKNKDEWQALDTVMNPQIPDKLRD